MVVVVMADCWSGCSVTTAPISRKLSEYPPLQPGHQLSVSYQITPFPFTLLQAHPRGHYLSSLTKGSPVGERDLWREQTSGFTQKWPFLNAIPGIHLSHL